ncbi:chromate efflux transporter [Methylophilus aquaticus]|uniref:Chromate efflux transporter n=1 Tax=Methylophilus aquaticus TaxID=1971610 RepID=A0ABT9JUP3_9PROT|nr:chromate efflux transporter [Methylophilus aquaticus]MDP8568317.1 chromate efflux transporter [Methylophilus aquaticus]
MDTHPQTQVAQTDQPAPVPWQQAFLYWLKLGFISFGGPAGQIALMHHDLVDKKRWISEKRFLHALNYCMVLPGPEAQQLATYIGWLMHRTWGGIMAGVLFVLPAFFLLTALGWLYMVYGKLPAVAGVLYGIKPAIVAIVVFAAYRIGLKALKNKVMWSIAALAFVAIFWLNLPFPLIICFAALLGHIGGRMAPQYFQIGSSHSPAMQSHGQALIDDDTSPPAHARFNWHSLRIIGVTGLLIWLLAMASLIALYGWQSTFSQMGWFFTKAALLTFGGAYAVLPYVFQGAVEHYHWLTPTQMIDGLALGETTPGPLIMVVTFVGFVGGWGTPMFGAEAPLASALLAAAIVTFFTFLPSFVFIFMGGPLIESTHGNLKLTAPLSAITAAVVGVILNLAVFFTYHVFWHGDQNGTIDLYAITLSLLAAIGLLYFRLNMMPVILVSGGLGLLIKLLI